MGKGFTLLEVIIAFIIATVSISTVLWIISNIESFNKKKETMEDLAYISEVIFLQTNNLGRIIDSYNESIDLNNIKSKFIICYKKEYNGRFYEVCYITLGSKNSKRKWKYIYEKTVPFLFSY